MKCPQCGHPESGWYEDCCADSTRFFTKAGFEPRWTCPEQYPRAIQALAAERAVQVSAGGGHSLVVSETGCLFTFGFGEALGHGVQPHAAAPQAVPRPLEQDLDALARGQLAFTVLCVDAALAAAHAGTFSFLFQLPDDVVHMFASRLSWRRSG